MSAFGGFGGGFGANNNQSSGFGGFGANNNNTTPNNTSGGFGSTGFGSNTGSNLFGGGNTGGAGAGGFGAGGGFGSNASSSPFGAKPAFGAATTSGGSSLFGGGTATSGGTGFGGGGFGSTTTPSTGFGGGNAGGSLFGAGQNKPAFGGTTGAGGGLFGGAGNTPGTTGSAFGAGGATAFGGGLNQTTNNGTAGTPFQAHVEKDGATSQNAHYQTITFQQPYQGLSLEELRLQDYAQGRRFGNANGQAGAFGASTGFGGFGANNNTATPGAATGGFGSTPASGGNLFGANNASSPFGGAAQNNTTSGFGSNTGGSLFGANKPATGTLFGNNAASSGQSSGGLFGTAGNSGTSAFGGGNAGGGFGSNNTAAGGLFGNNNNQQQQQQQQSKPAFGGFGGGAATGFGASTTGGTGFGGANTNTNSGGGGLFGNNNANQTSAFGGNNNQQGASNPFGGFGQNNQNQSQTQSQPAAGGLFGGFGQNNQNNQQQTKPLFGGATTGTAGGGLFGGNNQQQTQGGGGLFGGNNQQQGQTGGSLFGAKPPGQTGGLFGGGANTTPNTGGGLFSGGLGQNNQQNQSGGGLFGAKPPGQTGGLFGGGANTAPNAGGGLFSGGLGQNNAAPTGGLGGGLFGGGQQQNQQQQPPLGGSLFGASMAPQGGNQAPQLTASMNGNPYGNEHLFASLNSPGQSVGPLATPLSSSQKQKKNAILPQHRINPAASSRLITPQKRLNGYGFSYSTYGTPGSAMGSGSPSFSGSLIGGGGSFSRSLSKSFSTSSLKNTWNAEDSILSPGAFNPSKRPAYGNTGSMKKLNIDRALNVRPALFGDDSNSSPASQKKRVSFDASTTLNGSLDAANDALVPADRESTTPSAEEQGFLRSSRNGEKQTNGAAVNGDKTPEMEQSRGTELAVVPEEDAEADNILRIANEKARKAQRDQTPGKYWSEPSLDELKELSKQQLKSLENFKVGREGIGEIHFEHPVDLTAINLDDLFGYVIQLNVRNATVYPSKTSTPPMGKGLNVPSLIMLENSWPRAQAGRIAVHEKGGPRFQKHIDRLKKVEGTEFADYDSKTGTWTFRVQHYTTYGLDYDEDDEEDTMLTDPPVDLQSPTPRARYAPAPLSALSRLSQDDSTVLSIAESSPDDTFDFKKGLMRRTNVPGSFDEEDGDYEDDMEYGQDDTLHSTQSFLDERSVGPYEDGSDMDDAASYRSGSDSEPEHTMAGSFPIPDLTTEQTPAKNTVFDASGMPKSILKASRAGFDTPTKGAFDFEGDWAAQLQRTISPKKQDRQTLRKNQGTALRQFDDQNEETPKAPYFAKSTNKPFSNSIDLMNSLFGQSTARRTAAANGSPVRKGKGLEWPYQKRPKTGDELDDPSETEKAFHETFKPTWTHDGTLTYTAPGNASKMQGKFIANLKNSIVSEHKDVRFAKFSTPEDIWPATIVEQASANNTNLIGGSEDEPPRAETLEMKFADLANAVSIDTPAGRFEQEVWKLASILFDSLSAEDIPEDVPNDLRIFENQIRTMRLSEFWKSIVQADADRQARLAKSSEERAVARLSSHSITEACEALVEGNDFRLATLVAQIGGPQSSREAIAAQIEDWRAQNVLSEMSDSVRALYTILAGEFTVSDGAPGPAAENRAEDVRISSRFGLDWRQAFGFRLWYSRQTDTAEDGLIEYAVQRFEDELREGDEGVKLVPWFVRAGNKTGWEDPNPQERQDVLWGLLKLYKAYRDNDMTFSVADMLAPENTTGSPVNARLSWQLLTLLRARNILPREVVTSDMDYDGPREGEHFNAREITEISDALTQTFAVALLAPEHWTHAMWVLIHHTDDEGRATAIKDLLAFNAGNIGEDAASDATFAHLTTTLRIAPAWVYAAKAMYARAVLGDAVKEVQYLLQAGSFAQAHEVLCRAVAPAAVVANTLPDLEALAALLHGFQGAPEKDVIEWHHGGAVYADYLALLGIPTLHSNSNSSSSSRPTIKNNDQSRANNPFASLAPSASVFGDQRRGSAASANSNIIGGLHPDNALASAENSDNVKPILHRLSAALAGLAPQLPAREVLERAALKEVARTVVEGVKKQAEKERKSAALSSEMEGVEGSSGHSSSRISTEKERRNVLRMGVTEEASLWLGRSVGVEYWRAVVGGGGGW